MMTRTLVDNATLWTNQFRTNELYATYINSHTDMLLANRNYIIALTIICFLSIRSLKKEIAKLKEQTQPNVFDNNDILTDPQQEA